MSEGEVEIELARHQWEEGARALARNRRDRAAASRQTAQLELISAELARRVGQVFTLAELVRVYGGAERWTLAVLHERMPDQPLHDASSAVDAAFGLYARRASDYAP